MMDTTLLNDETLARHRMILVRMMFKVTAYYIVLAGAIALAAATIPGFTQQMPLGGVGEISDVGSSSIYDLEEALLSADDEQIEDIVTENTRARLARGPAWLTEALALIRDGLSEEPRRLLQTARQACTAGVRRCQIISYQDDCALLEELFTHDGCGTLVANVDYEKSRQADIDDVGGRCAATGSV